MANLLEEIKSNSERIARISRDNELLVQAMQVIGDVDLSDVAYVVVSQYGDSPMNLTLSLSDEKKDSHLAHTLCQRLGCRFEKEKSSWNESLTLTAELPNIQIVISGYQPATCRIVEQEEPLSVEEIEAAKAEALAQVKTVRVRRELICTE